jgi:serine/threonine-protein kinase
VRHENVVRSLDFGDGFVVFEFVGGGSLADVERPMSPDQAADLIARIADGVQAAHGQGLVHRDLKPANVLLDEDGTPKVADFGIAARESEIPALAALGAGSRPTGNRAFMAPELYTSGRSAISTRADVYALGAMLYWLLTNHLPQGRSLAEIESNQADGRRPDFDGIPTDLARICERAMDRDPALRYDSAAQLAVDLRRFLARRPLEWTRPSMRHRARLLWSRDPKLAVIGLVTLTLLIGSASGSGWYFAEYQRAKRLDEQRLREAQKATEVMWGLTYLLGVVTDHEDPAEDARRGALNSDAAVGPESSKEGQQ